jgi:nicotinamidase-related amidase
MNNTVLIIIDIQNMYFEEGSYKLFNAEEASLKAAEILNHFRNKNLPVVHIKHLFKDDKITQNELMRKREIHKNVMPANGEIVIEKNYPSSFLNTDLKSCLDDLKAEKLVVVGMMSHMCIDTTVRAAQNYGYAVTVLEDACTTKNLNTKNGEIHASVVHDVFMASLKGTFAQVMTVDEYIGKENQQ